MKFLKGVVIGGVISAGLALAYTDAFHNVNKKRLIRQGKRIARKIGMY
jgi:uncharacterized protein (DUF697 family)